MNAPARVQRREEEAGPAGLGGKYLTFRVGGEQYGLQILRVREIVALPPVTRVPGASGCVRGVVNLRGRVLPVVDMRERFGLPPVELTRHAVLIVAQVLLDGQEFLAGLQVEEVLEVAEFPASRVETPEALGQTDKVEFVLGMAKAESGLVFLLDPDRLLDGAQLRRIAASEPGSSQSQPA